MDAEQELARWKTINATRSVNELVAALEEMGTIEISGGRGAYDMAERVRGVDRGELFPNALTRNYGIRHQYLYLTDWHA